MVDSHVGIRDIPCSLLKLLRILIDAAPVLTLLLTAVLIIFPDHAFCLNDTLEFQRFSRNDGLAGNTVSVITQDRDGFLWIGTSDGLNRYDGSRFLTFRHDPQDSASLVSNAILSLTVDAEGNIWVGTEEGLDMFDRASGDFYHYRSVSDGGQVHSLCAGVSGYIWIGTDHGLFRFDPGSGTFKRYRHDPGDKGSLPDDKVSALAPDTDGGILIGTDGGLRRFDPQTDSFTRISGPNGEILDNIRNITSIVTDRRGDVWIASWSSGLYRYRPGAGSVETFRGGGGDQALTHTSVGPLALGADGTLWAGTLHGLNQLTDNEDGTVSVRRHYHNSDDPASLGSNAIWGLCVDAGGVLWVGTHRGGLHKMVPSMNIFTRYEHREGLDGSPGDNLVTDICADGGYIWLGTAMGISRFDPHAGTFTSFSPMSGLDASNEINDICVRDSRSLWCAANDGLWLFDRDEGAFEQFSMDDGLSGSTVLRLAEDRAAGTLWIGTDRGLRRLDTVTGELSVPEASIADGDILAHGTVISLIVDRAGAVWAGTGHGLYVRPPGGDAFIRHPHNSDSDTAVSYTHLTLPTN